MQKIRAVWMGLIFVFVFASSASALVVDFEDLYSGVEVADNIPGHYNGLNWGSAAWYVTKDRMPGTGYQAGTIDNVSMFSTFGLDAWVGGISDDFLGAYLTAGSGESDVTVEGTKDGSLLFSSDVTVFSDRPTWFDFNFSGVDTIFFKPGTELVVIDNLTFGSAESTEASPVPEPSTIVLMGVGFVGLALGCRRKMQK